MEFLANIAIGIFGFLFLGLVWGLWYFRSLDSGKGE
jgi:hypothetical protein